MRSLATLLCPLLACALAACAGEPAGAEHTTPVELSVAPPKAEPRETVEIPLPPKKTMADLLLVVDLSGSMRAYFGDTQETRLEVAKRTAVALAEAHTDGNVGLFIFGKEAYGVSPLGTDRGEVVKALGKLAWDTIDPTNTALAEGIMFTAGKLGGSVRPGEIVVITDGSQDTTAIPAETVGQFVKEKGGRVTFIQLATSDDARIQDGVDLLGAPRQVTVKMKIDTWFLETVAKGTDGARLVATDNAALETALSKVREQVR